jgi:hypothetical protein
MFSTAREGVASDPDRNSLRQVQDAVLDGEIVCLEKRDHPRFNDLLYSGAESRATRRLICCGVQARITGSMVSWIGKHELRQLLADLATSTPLRYVDHLERGGVALRSRSGGNRSQAQVRSLRRRV